MYDTTMTIEAYETEFERLLNILCTTEDEAVEADTEAQFETLNETQFVWLNADGSYGDVTTEEEIAAADAEDIAEMTAELIAAGDTASLAELLADRMNLGGDTVPEWMLS